MFVYQGLAYSLYWLDQLFKMADEKPKKTRKLIIISQLKLTLAASQ